MFKEPFEVFGCDRDGGEDEDKAWLVAAKQDAPVKQLPMKPKAAEYGSLNPTRALWITQPQSRIAGGPIRAR